MNNSYKYKFLAFWGASMVMLVCLAMATNIDWARPRFEEMLSRNLGRKVVLGHLSWNFSFNGLAVSASSLKVFDLDGHNPFLNAAHSEIGMAFSPLLHHEMVLQHIVMCKPEMWAVRLNSGQWNYADLIDSIVPAKFINAYDATVHVRDHAQLAQTIPNYDFEHVQLRFVNSHSRHSWPFFLSAELPRCNYRSTLSVSALGSGESQDWQHCHYKFKVKAKKIDPADLSPLVGCSAPITGIVDLEASGVGSFTNGFSGTVYTNVSNLQVTEPEFIQLPDINTKLATQFNWSGNTLCLDNNTAHVLLSLKGNPEKPDYTGKLSAKQVTVDQIMSWLPIKWQSPGGTHVLLKSPSDIEGRLEIKPDRSVTVSDFTLSSGKSKVCANGLWNPKSSNYNFKVSGQNVELSELGDMELNLGLNRASHNLSGHKGVNLSSKLRLSGRANFNASLKGSSGGQVGLTSLDANFLNDSASTKFVHLEALKGNLQYKDDVLTLNNLIATIDGDTIILNGSVKYTARRPDCLLNLTAEKINLTSLGSIFQLLNLNVPILQKNLLTGTVKSLDIKVRREDIQVAFVPDLIHYLPQKSVYPLEVSGGKIIYRDSSIELKSTDVVLKQGRLQTSGVLANLNSKPTLEWCRFKTKSADVAELSAIIRGPFIPPAVQREFKPYLALVDLSSLHGKMSMNMGWQKSDQTDNYTLAGTVGFAGIGGRLNLYNGLDFSNLYGGVYASGQQLSLQDLHGTVGISPFHLSGIVNNYRSNNTNWQIEGESELALTDALKFMPGNLDSKFKADGAFHFRTHLAGDKNNSTVIFSCHTKPSDHLMFSMSPLTLHNPANKVMRLDGSLLISSEDKRTPKNKIELRNCYLTVDKSVLCATGDYAWNNDNDEPTIAVHMWSAEPLKAATLLEIFGQPTSTANSTKQAQGSLYGSLEGGGLLSELSGKAFIGFSDLTVPQYDLQNANGSLDASRWIVLNLGSPQPVFGAPGSNAVLKLSQMESDRFKLQNVNVQLTSYDKNGHVLLAVKNGYGSVFGGTVHFAGWADTADHTIHMGMDAANINTNMVVSTLLNHPHELTGSAALTAVIDTNGLSKKQLISNLSGYGSCRVNNGTVYRFGSFQERLSQFNLLHQGVFGFNLNNLLQTMVPVRTGRFNELRSSFDIQKGVITFKELHYDANDMRLWGVGTANLPMDSIDMEIAGRIPRVLPSMIGGPMGKVSRTITLQNFFDVVTMHKLESLPSVPVLGSIADDRPRTFSFQILSPLDQPHSISKSIENTFAWLPCMPNASAHPLPALSLP